MDHVELSKRLRDLSKKGSTYRRTICKMAAQKIDKLAAELEKTKALLAQAVADLKQADVNCDYCDHKSPPAPCAEDEEHYTCDNCPHDCYCKDCVDNSKWEYDVGTDGRRTRGDWIRSMIASDNALADQMIWMSRTDAGQDLSRLWCDDEGGCKNYPDGECCDTWLKECVLRYLRQNYPEPPKEVNP